MSKTDNFKSSFWETIYVTKIGECGEKEWGILMHPITFLWFIFAHNKISPAPWRIKEEKNGD